ncbi:hypothetical protein PP182_12330 [Maribacter sp. PR1]|uniref:Sensor of ECF-type sigma factor n=1 Tax=Maribacter cobaltidurans TaxID=1178778 RepID=A0ABU7IV81_9FLAO|nr:MULTISPECIES: hypothetical protein [Maribacter]MDC6389475.1 hypothetical protein [Maribacter sp. PR1]MEE1976864.1 hypothetical protein [Maribacter cobaltidurans]
MNRLLLATLMLFTAMSFAQDRSREKIKSLKVAYLTEQLDLTSKEAQDFWPVYNEYEKKRHELRHKQWVEIKSKLKDVSGLNEQGAQNLLDSYIKIEEQEEELDKDYLNEISKVISAKKTLILMRSEEDFKRQLIKQYRHNKGGR